MPILVCDYESRTLTISILESKIQVFEIKILREIEGVKKKNKTKSEERTLANANVLNKIVVQ